MWIIIDCTHGLEYIEIIRDSNGTPIIFNSLEDAELYSEEIDIGVPQFIEMLI